MDHRKGDQWISELGDVELIRLLTRDAREQTPEAIAVATAEANRRGLPIDERFIPAADDPQSGPDVEVVRPGRFAAGGIPIRCPHCRADRFEARDMLLNTRGLTFLKLDWLNRSATALVCAKCGMIQLLAAAPVRIEDE